jgi:hypothetical protein
MTTDDAGRLWKTYRTFMYKFKNTFKHHNVQHFADGLPTSEDLFEDEEDCPYGGVFQRCVVIHQNLMPCVPRA